MFYCKDLRETYIIVIVVIIVVIAAITEITKQNDFVCRKAFELYILNIDDNIDNGVDKYSDKSNVTHSGKRATIIASFV